MDKNKIINFLYKKKFSVIFSTIFIITLTFYSDISQILKENINLNLIQIILFFLLIDFIFSFFLGYFISLIIKTIVFFYYIVMFPSNEDKNEKSSTFYQYCSAHIKYIYEQFKKKRYITLQDILKSEELQAIPDVFTKIFFNSLIKNYIIKSNESVYE